MAEKYQLGVIPHFSFGSRRFLTGKYRSQRDTEKATRAMVEKYRNEWGFGVVAVLDRTKINTQKNPRFRRHQTKDFYATQLGGLAKLDKLSNLRGTPVLIPVVATFG